MFGLVFHKERTCANGIPIFQILAIRWFLIHKNWKTRSQCLQSETHAVRLKQEMQRCQTEVCVEAHIRRYVRTEPKWLHR